jgi:hypothetical protein
MPGPTENTNAPVQCLTVSMGGEPYLFDFGRIYLVFEKKTETTFRIVQDFVYSGSEMMCVTRCHPDVVNERFPGKCTDSIWLSERSGPGNIPPDQLNRVIQRVGAFLVGRKNPVVLLDGVEYLSVFNDFSKVNMFLEELNDLVMASKAILFVPIDPQSLDPRSLARLRRYTEVVA